MAVDPCFEQHFLTSRNSTFVQSGYARAAGFGCFCVDRHGHGDWPVSALWLGVFHDHIGADTTACREGANDCYRTRLSHRDQIIEN